MIYVYDELTKQGVYINKNHVVFAIPIETRGKYELYLTNDDKARVDYDAFERFRKRLL
uniref:Uncharacterized protein n=1 Tax=Siphoviridae sp. ctHjK2 TaxID=2827831 RepID=A0A8S5SRM6_9CAUD|nr:MAG TPA: hypothetical protein [Siphoviridae sp. ctHjK2]